MGTHGAWMNTMNVFETLDTDAIDEEGLSFAKSIRPFATPHTVGKSRRRPLRSVASENIKRAMARRTFCFHWQRNPQTLIDTQTHFPPSKPGPNLCESGPPTPTRLQSPMLHLFRTTILCGKNTWPMSSHGWRQQQCRLRTMPWHKNKCCSSDPYTNALLHTP